MLARGLGVVAALLAVASATVSAYWLLGGTGGLDTVGGAIERQARDRTPAALAVLACTAAAKCAGAVVAILLVVDRAPRWLVRAALVAGVVLSLYGALLVAVGSLALGGVLDASGADRHALAWHVGLWDPWFLLWGLALGGAAAVRLRERRLAASR